MVTASMEKYTQYVDVLDKAGSPQGDVRHFVQPDKGNSTFCGARVPSTRLTVSASIIQLRITNNCDAYTNRLLATATTSTVSEMTR
jgi:hypothetical protein